MERPSTLLKLLDVLRSWEADLLNQEEVLDEIQDFGLELDFADEHSIHAIEYQGGVPVVWIINFRERDILVG